MFVIHENTVPVLETVNLQGLELFFKDCTVNQKYDFRGLMKMFLNSSCLYLNINGNILSLV